MIGRIYMFGVTTLIALGITTSASAFQDRSDIYKHFESQRQQLRAEFNQKKNFAYQTFKQRDDRLDDAWRAAVRHLSGKARVAVDANFRERSKMLRRNYDEQVKDLNQWMQHESNRLIRERDLALQRYDDFHRRQFAQDRPWMSLLRAIW